MRYADSKCTYREEYKPEHVYIFTGKCVITGDEYSVTIPAPELYAYRRGALIQDAMPSVSMDDLEFLISGMTPVGWEKAFPSKDEE